MIVTLCKQDQTDSCCSPDTMQVPVTRLYMVLIITSTFFYILLSFLSYNISRDLTLTPEKKKF